MEYYSPIIRNGQFLHMQMYCKQFLYIAKALCYVKGVRHKNCILYDSTYMTRMILERNYMERSIRDIFEVIKIPWLWRWLYDYELFFSAVLKKTYLFLAVLDLLGHVASLAVESRVYSLVVVLGLLIVVASPAEYRL